MMQAFCRIPKSTKPRPHSAVAAFVASLLTLSACTTGSVSDDDVSRITSPPQETPETAAAVTPNPSCGAYPNPAASYAPFASIAEANGPAIDRIRAKGKLVAGTSADTLLFGSRNAFTGKLEGFDIDMLRALTEAIFGPNTADERLQIRVITYAQRLPLLEAKEIDVVAHTMTINCARWNRIAFSSEYYTAGQQLVVNKESSAKTIESMPAKSRICVPSGGTSVAQLAEYKANDFVPVEVDDVTECLVKLQRGEADAVLSDNTVGEGFAKQDPYVKVVGPFVSTEPYGLGFNKVDTDLVQLMNRVLEDLRSSGGLARLLQKNSLAADKIPAANHSRVLP